MLHAPVKADRNAHRVYVIDDQPELRESSCFLLTSLGLTCVQYPEGPDFLDEVDRLEPGCILLDLVMHEMDGLEVQQELKRRRVSWPIIFMSGHDDIPAVISAVKNGAVEFLEKPFSEEELLAALHRGFVQLREGSEPA
jgi:two-component system, LuxR family, response regulator FixJ